MRPKENPWGWPQACEPTVCLKYQMGRGTRSTSTLQHIARVLTGSDLLEDREFSQQFFTADTLIPKIPPSIY